MAATLGADGGPHICHDDRIRPARHGVHDRPHGRSARPSPAKACHEPRLVAHQAQPLVAALP